METEVAATFYNAKEALPFRVTLTEMGHPQLPTHMEVDNETAIGFLNSTMKQNRSKEIDMRFYWVRDRVKQNQFLIYWRPGANNVGEYVSKHHSPAHHQTMSPKIFVNLVCQNPSSYTENCLHILSLFLQQGCDNPTINSSIVGLSHPRFRHIDNLCTQFSVEEKGFWQTRFTKTFGRIV